MTIKQIREMLRFIDKLDVGVDDAIEAIDYLADIYERDDMNTYKDWVEEGQFREKDNN